jgi:hypothetical protein
MIVAQPQTHEIAAKMWTRRAVRRAPAICAA